MIVPTALRLMLSACFASTWMLSPASAAGPGSVAYQYDDLGRLRVGTYSDRRVADYRYDAAGNRTTSVQSRLPELFIAAPGSSATEGGSLSFTVTRTGTSSAPVTVDCVPTDGTAKSGGSAPFDDYLPATQQIVFLPTEASPASRNCLIVTKEDSFYEGTQTVIATLQQASSNALIVIPSATGLITDNDLAPSFSVANASKAENGGTLDFPVTKSTAATEYSHSITYGTANGTATTADNDYVAASGTLTFASSETAKQVNVSLVNDAKFEPNETLSILLTSPTNGATLGTASATGTITNDDPPPSIAINSPAAANEGSAITFTVTKSGTTSLSHSVNWTSASNTATSGSDFTAASGVLVFLAGETTKTLQVQTLTDSTAESSETFYVNLTTNANTNGATISVNRGTGTINDVLAIPSAPNTISHAPNDNTGSFTVSWSASTGPVSYYSLEEDLTFTGAASFSADNTFTTTSLNRAFSRPGGEYGYRVRACNSSNQCSAYAGPTDRTVCAPGGCQ